MKILVVLESTNAYTETDSIMLMVFKEVMRYRKAL